MSGQSTGPTSSYRALTAEVEQLRAELARLTEERDAARVEASDLKWARDDAAVRDALLAVFDEMRAAFVEVVNASDYGDDPTEALGLSDLRDLLARAAAVRGGR